MGDFLRIQLNFTAAKEETHAMNHADDVYFIGVKLMWLLATSKNYPIFAHHHVTKRGDFWWFIKY